MDNLIYLDFETASKCDLAVHGLGRYLVEPTTRVTCLAYRLPRATSTELWIAEDPFPAALKAAVGLGVPFVAHNAPFDFWIWNKVLCRDQPDLPQLRLSQVNCSSARARYNGLPSSLANACEALNLPIQKDMGGKSVMLELALNPEWTPATHPDLFARLFKYAITDVDAMIGLWNATKPLPEREVKFFLHDMRVNHRGFGVDVEGAEAMERMKALAEAQLDETIAKHTQGGVLSITEIAKIKEYAKGFGEEIDDGGREALTRLAAKEGLAPEVKTLLELRLDASRAPKKSAAILRAHVNGRIQHSTMYHGSLTGRSSARGAGGVQLLNVARPRPGHKAKDCESYLEAAKRGDVAFLSSPGIGPVLAALSDAQRALFRAAKPGYTLVVADLSGIEARMAPWLANDEPLLKAFDEGADTYKLAAVGIYGKPYDQITDQERHVGKIATLSLGYGGGAGAFKNLAATQGVVLPDDQIDETVVGWRSTRPAFERWWASLEYAALIALDQPGREVVLPVGRGHCTEVMLVRDERALRMHLPSGRAISYHNARLLLDAGATVPVAVYDKPEGYTETLDRKITSNNQTQGLSRDLFWNKMLDIAPHATIVHHVYDEVILEVPTEIAELRLEQLLELLRIPYDWCQGLPLNASGYVSDQWRK